MKKKYIRYKIENSYNHWYVNNGNENNNEILNQKIVIYIKEKSDKLRNIS